MSIIRAACVQMNSGGDIADNLKVAEQLIRAAAEQGAVLIATPEVTDQVISNRAERLDETYTQDDHPGVAQFSALAKELGVTLLIGSMIIRKDNGKAANRSFVFTPDGSLTDTYDKIHLYDVDLPSGESHRESKVFDGGDRAVIANTEAAQIGLSICYDVRFPHLYRGLVKRGAHILSIPAAFTAPTGQAHWETLLRARAIETGSFVLAAAQGGDHDGARQTYGHSMIISPWGRILAHQEGQGEGVITADLDLSEATQARTAIPTLTHDREYTF